MFVCNMARVVSLAVAAGIGAGCTTVAEGTDFDMAKAQSFVKGRTTRPEIIAVLGPPASTGTTGDGGYIEYRYQRTSVSVLTGFGVGTVDDHQKLCRFTLDKQHVLREFTCAEGTPNYSTLGK